MILRLPQGREGSEYVLSFESGQREGGLERARTDRHTDGQTDTFSSALVYRYINTAAKHTQKTIKENNDVLIAARSSMMN